MQFLVCSDFCSYDTGLCVLVCIIHWNVPVLKCIVSLPWIHTRNSDQTKIEIWYLFGIDALDNEVVKTFTKADLHLPTSPHDLIKQIECMIRLLDLITGRNSVASAGYREAHHQLKTHRKKLISPSVRKSIWMRIGFFVDHQVFQSFATDLANNHKNDSSRRCQESPPVHLLSKGSMEKKLFAAYR